MNRFLADENLPLPVVAELRSLGYDVITIQETGKGNQQFPDEKVLHLASEQGRALVTLNRKHFIRLHHLNKKQALIIVSAICRPGLKPQAITCRPYGTSPSGTTGNSPAIYCRVDERMIKAEKHGGIIICSMNLDYPGQAHRIHQAVKSYISLAGLLIRINRGSIKGSSRINVKTTPEG